MPQKYRDKRHELSGLCCHSCRNRGSFYKTSKEYVKMKNLKRSVCLLAAALGLFAACSPDPAGEDLPGADLTAPEPSALPLLADGVTLVATETEARGLFNAAFAGLPDVLEAFEAAHDEDQGDDGEWSIRGGSASRAGYSESFGPYTYYNDTTLVPGASVTGYFKGSFKKYSENETGEPSPEDYTEEAVESQFELDLLEGITEDNVTVKGKIAVAIDNNKKIYSDPLRVSAAINQGMMYALAVTDTEDNIGGRFIFELGAWGAFESDVLPPDISGMTGMNSTVTLKVYNNEDTEILDIDLKEDILDYLEGLSF
jgi:hypothetical protein